MPREPSEPLNSLYAAGPHPGGKRPAAGRLGLVQAFVNSHFALDAGGVDLLATPHDLRGWLEARGLTSGRLSRAEHDRAVTVREGLHAQLAEHNAAAPDPVARAALREASFGLSAAYELDDDGATVARPSAAGVSGALGLVLAVVHESRAAGTWPRLKACPGEHCGWVFYDHSLNAGGTWCSMQLCGSREKARAYRRRSRCSCCSSTPNKEAAG